MKTWFVTGASRGLGRALVEHLLEAGEQVCATALPDELSRLSALADAYGDRAAIVALDVRDEPAARTAIAAAHQRFGRIDVVVNNAGYGNVASIEDTSIEDFKAQIETNLFGTIYVTKAALPLLRAQGHGHFIQFASIAARMGPAGRGAYTAAKCGVEGFSEVLAKETGPLGLKVTIIEPGGFRTDFAGASTRMSAGRPEYAATVGKVIEFQTAYNGQQPGDPKRAAVTLANIANMASPPMRVVLGSAAYRAAEDCDLARVDELRRFKDLSTSTDFPEAHP